jgi:Tol biopolymer transport system component
MKARLAALITGSLIALLAVPATAHEPGDLTLYLWDGGGGQFLYKAHPNGSEEERLADFAPYFLGGTQTAISPNGNKVAYFGRGEFRTNIFVSKMSGGEPLRLTGGQGIKEDPAWSPNGRKIVADCGSQLCVMKSNGDGRPRDLTDNGYSENDPQWSPDGKWIAFDTAKGLMKIRPDGSDLTKLTDHDRHARPRWSPDSDIIVFNKSEGKVGHLFRIRSDGSGMRKITDANRRVDEEHDWAPDGSRLVFVRTEYRRSNSCSHLWTIKPNGHKANRISGCFRHSGDVSLYPVWSPDSQRIAYIAGYRPKPDDDLVGAVFTKRRGGQDTERIMERGDDFDDIFGLDW